MRKGFVFVIILVAVLTLAAQVSFTPEQQKQYAKCTAAAEKVQTDVRELLKLANGPDFGAEKAKLQAKKVNDAYLAMHEQHSALVHNVPEAQSKIIEPRKAKMDQACMRIRASLKELELTTALATPDPKKVAKDAQIIETAMLDWQKEHRAMGQEMGIRKN